MLAVCAIGNDWMTFAVELEYQSRSCNTLARKVPRILVIDSET